MNTRRDGDTIVLCAKGLSYARDTFYLCRQTIQEVIIDRGPFQGKCHRRVIPQMYIHIVLGAQAGLGFVTSLESGVSMRL